MIFKITETRAQRPGQQPLHNCLQKKVPSKRSAYPTETLCYWQNTSAPVGIDAWLNTKIENRSHPYPRETKPLAKVGRSVKDLVKLSREIKFCLSQASIYM